MYATDPPNEISYLYCIHWDSTPDVVKLGRTTNIAARFNQFLTGHHEELHVLCLADESVMSEADMHARHNSARKTLEWFNYTDDLKATVEMLNMSSGFKPYIIPRTRDMTGLVEDCPAIEALKQEICIPPLRLSRMERAVAELAAVGTTVEQSAEAFDLSASAIKTHRSSVVSKCAAPNLLAAITKLFVHKVIDTETICER